MALIGWSLGCTVEGRALVTTVAVTPPVLLLPSLASAMLGFVVVATEAPMSLTAGDDEETASGGRRGEDLVGVVMVWCLR
jgi:hypothetical protein